MPAPKGHEPYKGCETGGRPKIYTKEVIDAYAEDFANWLKDDAHVWYKDWALDRDLEPNLLGIWAKENEKFSGVLIAAQERQQSRLVNGGLQNKYNGGIVKLVLANAHGWRTEKTESKISGDPQNPLAFLLAEVQSADASKELVVDECDPQSDTSTD